MLNPIIIPELQELIASNDSETIREFCQETHPATVAELIEGLETAEIWKFLSMLDIPLQAEIFCCFDLDKQVELVSGQNRKDMARLIEEMPPDDRVDLVQKLDEKVTEEILPLIAKAEREDIRKLLSYEQGTAGAVMNTDYAVLNPDTEIANAVEQLRIQAPGKETIYYIYVVDESRKLIGFVSLKDIITAKPSQKIKDIMHEDVICSALNDDQEVVAKKIEKYDLIAIPIVDENNILVGIVTYDDALDIIRQEHTEDMEKFMGIAGKHEVGDYLKTTSWQHFSKRAIWVMALAIFGFIPGAIIHSFESTLMSLIILAFYMPMIADTGGNTGSQSATVVIRALALGQIRPKDFLKIFFKEFKVSIMLAFTLGVLAFIRVMFLSRGVVIPEGLSLIRIALAITIALSIQVITSTLIGSVLPIIAARFKKDPAVVASPALTTMVDISGLLIYFTTAKLILGI
ncbi:MAG: magnesium transporter [Phycisphaerae bacterium]